MQTLEAIAKLNKLLSPPEAVTPEKLIAAQKFLSTLRPLQLLNLVYSQKFSGHRPALVAELSAKFKTRKELLRSVYGDDRIFQDTTYVRLPSLEKRVLVSRLVDYASKRYSWLSPRLIHAFAFRPDYFGQRGKGGAKRTLGPLYRCVEISKGGSSRRRLWIPSPPLRRVQRCLLELSLNQALGELPSCVNGCRPRLGGLEEYGIFRNAAAHLGQELVVNFDITNFFPSITVSEIIPALLTLQSPMVLKNPRADLPEGEAFYWKHDAAVLVARLVTHRGRLPQGAPTSPAIANLVFKSFDEKILKRLGPDFVYTRYVDDLTISVSSSSARRQRIRTLAEMRTRVEAMLLEILAGSRFALNQRKTRVTSLPMGHSITGLRVTADKVDLPRKMRRRIRSLLYHIRTKGFVETACDLIGGEIHAQTSYRSQETRSPGWRSKRDCPAQDHVRAGRRLSTERLAVLMLKRLYPDLRIEIPDAMLYSGNARIKRPAVLHQGKEAWNDVEKILTLLWENNLYVEDDHGHTSVKQADGSLLCRMRSETPLSFFYLAKREAIATVELWHHLRGLSAGMSVKDGDRCFGPIKHTQLAIDETLSKIRIDIPVVNHGMRETVSNEVIALNLTLIEEIVDLAKRVLELVTDMHLPVCGRVPDAKWTEQTLAFRKPAMTCGEFRAWCLAADHILNATFARLPILRDSPKSTPSMVSTVFCLIRILKDRLEHVRFGVYGVEKQILGKARLKYQSIDGIQDADALTIQGEILRSLSIVFDESSKLRTKIRKQSEWLETLVDNERLRGVSERLASETVRFIKLRENAVWPVDGQKVFAEDVNCDLVEQASELETPITGGQWKTVWSKLFECGLIIISATTDSGAEQSGEEWQRRFNEAIEESKGGFNVIRFLRHRKAHGMSFSGLPDDAKKRIHVEWLTVQNWASKRLGRIWNWREKDGPRHAFFDDQRDMQITPLEGTELKIGLLSSANEALEKLRRVQ